MISVGTQIKGSFVFLVLIPDGGKSMDSTFLPLKKLGVPSLTQGLVIDTSMHSNSASLGTGFSNAESCSRWTDRKGATFALNIPRQTWTSSWRIEATAQVFVVLYPPYADHGSTCQWWKITKWEFIDTANKDVLPPFLVIYWEKIRHSRQLNLVFVTPYHQKPLVWIKPA